MGGAAAGTLVSGAAQCVVLFPLLVVLEKVYLRLNQLLDFLSRARRDFGRIRIRIKAYNA